MPNDKLIALFEGGGDFIENAVSGGGPTKWFGLIIVFNDLGFDRLNEMLDRPEASSADGFGGNLCKPSLYLIDPGTTRGSKMQHVTWVPSKPVAHLRSFVGG